MSRGSTLTALAAGTCLCLTVACGRAATSGSADHSASSARTEQTAATASASRTGPTATTANSPISSSPAQPPQLSCSSVPTGPPLALAWPIDPSLAVVVDLTDIAHPRTLCTLTNAYSIVRFNSATVISYAPYTDPSSVVGVASRLIRTDLATGASQTFATAHAGRIDAWAWSPDGQTLVYLADSQLWLKAGDHAAVAVASYTSQPGRGGGWDDEIAVRFSPSGEYFVAVDTVTIPLTFEIRRASDGGLVWSSPSADFGASGFATMAVWSRQVDRLFFHDGTGVRAWEPSGTVTTLAPGLKWISPSLSPDEHKIAYTVLDPTTFHLRVELLDLQTLQVRVLSPDRWNAIFASDDLLLYGKAGVQIPDKGTLAYDLKTGVETVLPFDILLDVWPR
jgi:hypothetical protein